MNILKSLFGKKEGNSSCCNIQIQEVEKTESKEEAKEELCCNSKTPKNDNNNNKRTFSFNLENGLAVMETEDGKMFKLYRLYNIQRSLVKTPLVFYLKQMQKIICLVRPSGNFEKGKKYFVIRKTSAFSYIESHWFFAV